MRKLITYSLSTVLLVTLFGFRSELPADEWISLFDGKTLNNWKVGEHPATFSVADGAIVVFGERAHLFYEGPVKNHDFKNFEFKMSVMTTPGSNSGIFIHTAFQEEGWPSKGYEIQVNNSHTDWRRTGSVYALQDVREAPAQDKPITERQYTLLRMNAVSDGWVRDVVAVDTQDSTTFAPTHSM